MISDALCVALRRDYIALTCIKFSLRIALWVKRSGCGAAAHLWQGRYTPVDTAAVSCGIFILPWYLTCAGQ